MLIASGVNVEVFNKVRSKINTMMLTKCLIPQSAYSPLHLAAENCHFEIVEILVRAGADINAVNKVQLYTNNSYS